jgi:hypothetical protein
VLIWALHPRGAGPLPRKRWRPEAGAQEVALRAREVFTAASATLAMLVASYADLILARYLLAPEQSGAYAVGAVLTRAAIWAPQVITLLALPRLAQGRGRALWTGLAMVGAVGVVLVVATAGGADLAVRLVGGARYHSLAASAPSFVAVGALYAMTFFLLNAQLAVGARWPAAALWVIVGALLWTAVLIRPSTVGQVVAYSLAAAALSTAAMGIAVIRRGRGERSVTGVR